jgi:hypothetical protein
LSRYDSYSGLQKLSIECKTCGVSDSFYSSTSITRFKLEHADHDVIESRPRAWPRTELPNGRQDAANGEKVRLLKVLVELVMLPSYPRPVFTITGVKEDLKSAFVHVVPPSQRDHVNETLEKGKYLDSGFSDTVYVWEKKAVSFSDDATLAMGLVRGPKRALPGPANEGPFLSQSSPTSADFQETPLAVSSGERLGLAADEVPPLAEAPAILASPSPSEPAEPPASTVFPGPPQVSSPAAASPSADAAALKEPSPEPSEVAIAASPVKKEVAATASGDGPRQAKAEEGNYLLVSRSWYIEGGSKNMSEAVRISRLLRPFRWTVQPAYTIGVMVDDILSVETANGEIGGDLTKQIEGAGYKLSRVSVEKGKPVAWFKREPASGRDAPGP